MAVKYVITAEQKTEIEQARKTNKDKGLMRPFSRKTQKFSTTEQQKWLASSLK